jgi:uncharacterized protein RhaS with RHS repeats
VTRGGYSESLGTDGYDNPVRVTRNGIATTFSYDALSNKTFESLPASASGTSSPRDILGRVTALVNSDGTRRSISYSGSTARITDERGNATTYRYAAYGDPDTKFLIGVNLRPGII